MTFVSIPNHDFLQNAGNRINSCCATLYFTITSIVWRIGWWVFFSHAMNSTGDFDVGRCRSSSCKCNRENDNSMARERHSTCVGIFREVIVKLSLVSFYEILLAWTSLPRTDDSEGVILLKISGQNNVSFTNFLLYMQENESTNVNLYNDWLFFLLCDNHIKSIKQYCWT